jgi:hypothetical protein
MYKKVISLLLAAVMLFALSATALADGAAALTAPVLDASKASADAVSVTLAAPAASAEDTAAAVQYRSSADGGTTWGDWQTSPAFTGLTKLTAYSFEAKYVSSDAASHSDSEPSAAIQVTTADDVLHVTFRLIGGTLPTSAIDLDTDYKADDPYHGAVYQNWLKTASITMPLGSNSQDLIKTALTAAGIAYTLGTSSRAYVTAPGMFGGQTLRCDSKTPKGRWYVRIQKKDGTVTETEARFKSELADGDQVTFHYTYDTRLELPNGEYIDPELYDGPKFVEQYLKTPDVGTDEVAAAQDVTAQIDGIGRVTRDSGDAIAAARAAYDALTDAEKTLVTNSAVLTAAEARLAELNAAAGVATLAAPVLSAEGAAITKQSVALTAPAASAVDAAASIQYRYSSDGSDWSSWQDSPAFTGLQASTQYSFEARYVTSDLLKYNDSEPCAPVKIVTSAGSQKVYITITNRDAFVSAISGAATDGTETILLIKKDIETGVKGVNQPVLPAGSNITIEGAGGSLLGSAGGQNNAGLKLGENATLTLRNIRYSSIGPMDNGNFTTLVWFAGNNGTLNLDNAVLYGECYFATGIVGISTWGRAYTGCTVNIYSGVIANLNTGSANDSAWKVMNIGSSTTVNLMPTGNISIEGSIAAGKNINIIPQAGYPIRTASALSASFGSYTSLAAKIKGMNAATAASPYTMSIDGLGGLRVNVTDDSLAIPQKLAAPAVTADDLTVTTNSIALPENLTSSEDSAALYQYRWGKSAKTVSWNYSGWITAPRPFTITGLAEDTEYVIQIRFNPLADAKYCNSEITELKVKTKYTVHALTAPTLSDSAEKTASSVKLTAPAASAQDSAAKLQYRISADGETWGEWQDSAEFTGLTASSDYSFQARYQAAGYLWSDSDASAAVKIRTKTPELTAPVLSDKAVTAQASVTLTAPAASAEDTGAKLQYRMSTDGTAWGEWQDSAEFTGLSQNTKYFFQARYQASAAAHVDSAASNTVALKTPAAADAAQITVSEASGDVGKQVKITVAMKNNPGLVLLTLKLHYDSQMLRLVSAENGTLLTDKTFGPTANNPFIMSWDQSLDASGNVTADGTLATLTFEILKAGSSDLTLECSASANDPANPASFPTVVYQLVDGKATGVQYALGDVNKDGTVDGKDVAAMRRYIAGWTDYNADTLCLSAADVNADGTIDGKDVALLRRYLAGWDVTLGK